MKKRTIDKTCILALALAGMFVTVRFVFTEKPSWAGNEGKSWKHEQKKKHESNKDRDHGYSQDQQGYDFSVSIFFGDQQRNAIRTYYKEQYRSGHCPPGLAKKNNGCMPPGQARKWQMGRPLPRDLLFHDLPSALVVQIGPPPAGHRFVRVASDILLITIGTGMIVDAIQDLGDIR
ncbi:MAG: RcnB family protein [Proteobacteria bacterium]|nr:RcnB family protein [Pseudomonadota bacterium]MBU1061043.1 RcnB family protein [Pseudomonadota bacterium]